MYFKINLEIDVRISIISFTKRGTELSRALYNGLKNDNESVNNYAYEKFIQEGSKDFIKVEAKLSDLAGGLFNSSDAIIFIGAIGIAVRAIAPYIKDKYTDPAIICMDDFPRYIIPILSGHIGGANKLARCIESLTGAKAIITTATDNHGIWAVDEWAKDNALYISDRNIAKLISADLLAGKSINILSDYKLFGSIENYFIYNKENKYSVYIGNYLSLKGRKGNYIDNRLSVSGIDYDELNISENMLRLIPKNICLGIGCKRNTSFEKILEYLKFFLENKNIDINSIGRIASIDIKKNEEGILRLAKYLGVDFTCYTKKELLAAKGDFSESEFVRSITGVGNVCERAAALVYKDILCEKHSYDGITFALSIDRNKIYNINYG